MASTADKRAWLADHGHPELRHGKGRLPAALHSEYDAANPAAPVDDYAPGTGPDDFDGAPLDFVGPEPPADDGVAAILEDAARHDAEDATRQAAFVEERPGRPGGARPAWRWPAFGRASRGARNSRGTRQQSRRTGGPRVSLAPMIEDTYADLAWAAAPVPPMQRLLYAQAPIAGAVLDPAISGTVADGVMQPLARNYQRMKIGMALVGTPAALMAALASAPVPVMDQATGQPLLVPVLDEDGQPNGQMTLAMESPTMQHQTAMLTLRYCVRAMADIAGGEALERVTARAAENAARDDHVNSFIGFLMGAEVPEDAADTAAAEARDAGLRLAGATIDG